MKKPVDAATVRIPPPVVFVVSTLLGVLIERFVVPARLPLDEWERIGGSIVLVVLATALMGAAFGPFRKTGQDPRPWRSTPSLVATGVYRFTRNPMYVSMALIQVSLAVAFRNGWILVTLPVSMIGVYLAAIRHEEAYLDRKFGEAYRSYRRSVRRWL
jgi:protein-S-isoprenylcysteine O-methyltransferase Ste14